MRTHFNRNDYYSKTEVLKLFKTNAATYHTLLLQNNIPVVNNTHDLGTYKIITMYVLKTDVERLGLTNRK